MTEQKALTKDEIIYWLTHYVRIATSERKPALANVLKEALSLINTPQVSEMTLKFARYIVSLGYQTRDHACSECVPGGEIVVPGFVCAYHEAKRMVND